MMHRFVYATSVQSSRLLLTVIVTLALTVDAQPARVANDRETDAMIASLTPREQIAQLFIVSFEGTEMSADLARLVREWGVGGVVFYASNLQSVDQARRLTANILREARNDWRAPLLAVDQEGGTVVRLRTPYEGLPSAMALGATGSSKLARRAGREIGATLQGVGFTLNFAPVLDVSAGANTSLDRRRFHSDPKVVASLAAAFLAGQQEAGIVAVAKHFPGHGASPEDAHTTLPVNAASAETVRRRDLMPFRVAIQNGLEAIMTAHIRVPSLAEDEHTPASLSVRLQREVLRDELGFDGVVISDEIRMKALGGTGEPADAAINALRAGADMVLLAALPRERERIFESVVAAYVDGRLPSVTVRTSLRRVLRLKQRLAERAAGTVALRDGTVFAEIAAHAVTIVGNVACTVPMDVKRLGPELLYVGPAHAIPVTLSRATRVSWVGAPGADSESDVKQALLKDPAAIVLVAQTETELAFARRIIRAAAVPRVLVWMGDPYALAGGPQADATILTYGSQSVAIRTAWQVLTGEMVADGTLPITLPAALPMCDRCLPVSSSAMSDPDGAAYGDPSGVDGHLGFVRP